MRRRSHALAILFAIILSGDAVLAAGAQAGAPNQGAQRFVEFCAGCHGADGKGGDKAPSLVAPSDTATDSEPDLIRVIRDGTTRGMPPFAQIGDANIEAIVHYLRTLQGREASAGDHSEISLTGDPKAGRALFFGKARCAACHMMQGQGGFIAAGLTNYARNRTPESILHAITSPDDPLLPSSRVVTITTRTGQRLTGALRNEDNFTVALQTEDGRYHLLQRTDLSRVQYTDHSLMPRDYGRRFTATELDDIVSFLIIAGRTSDKDARLGN